MKKYLLTRSTPSQLKICPEHVWSTGCGVFRTEEDCIQMLRYYMAPLEGDCLYLGTEENPLEPPLRIYAVNYELTRTLATTAKQLTSDDLQIGTIAVIVGGPYDTHVVLKASIGLVNLSDPNTCWTNLVYPLNVRLLNPGEQYTIKGR